MTRKFASGIDLLLTQLVQAVVENLASEPVTPTAGRVYFNTSTLKFGYGTGSAWVYINDVTFAQVNAALAAANADISVNSQKITNLADPTAAQHAATKAYVDAVKTGLDVKDSVRVASTANINLSAPGTTIDGVTMATNDRFLAKDQSTGSQNGIYVWNGAASAATRATDADSDAEVTAGLYVWVTEGTVNGDSGWLLTTNDTIVVGTTSLTFSQFSGAGQITAGAGLTKTGNTLDIVAASGSGIVVNADNIDIDPVSGLPLNRGGTGAITAAGAKTNLGFMTRYSVDIGNGSLTDFTINHNLGTRDVSVVVRRNSSPYDKVECDDEATDTNNVTLRFASAPTTNQYRVHVIG